MTRLQLSIVAAAALTIGLVAGVGAAQAQSGAVTAAIAAGDVGEQADGYLGIRGQVAQGVRAEVDSINIRRREVYTRQVDGRPVSVEQMAAATGCRTLARVRPGQAYRDSGGAWHVRGAGDPPPSGANCPTL